MRSMWRGSISFGLVNIPVKMYSATEEKSLRFNQLHTLCNTQIKYDKICPNCERSVAQDEIVRGYQYSSGQFVIITDEEWKTFQEQSTKTIDILRFVDLQEIDPIYFNKTYFLEPAETGWKAYLLLQEALSLSGKIAVSQITIRSKPTLAVVRVYENSLTLETIFYPDEIRDVNLLNLEAPGKVGERELTMALSLISSLTESFKPEEYEDERRTAMLELIEGKIQGQDIVLPKQGEREVPVDLLAALEASLRSQEPRIHH